MPNNNTGLEIWVYANDPDNALELAGNSADTEFKTVAAARAGFDQDFHELKTLYRILVEEVPGE